MSDLTHNERCRRLIEATGQGIIVQNSDGKVVDMNLNAKAMLGLTETDLESMERSTFWGAAIHEDGTLYSPEQYPACQVLDASEAVTDIVMGVFHKKEKRYRWIMVNAAPFFPAVTGGELQLVSSLTDITALKERDDVLKSHMRFLNAMERISQITLGSDSVEGMLYSVLQEMLDIFACDRAWLLYPCDASARSWRVPMAQDRPEWPGLPMGVDVPMTDFVRNVFKTSLELDGASCFNALDQPNLAKDPSIAEFHIQSQMTLPIYPKVDKPWLLGIHHCSNLVKYSDEDKALFEEVGRRIADSLTTLLTLREMKESEERFRTLVEHAPEAIFVLDAESGLITDINGNAINLFKKTHAKLLNTDFILLSPEVQSDGERSIFRLNYFIDQAMNGEAPVFEWDFIDASGTNLLCEVRLVRLPARGKALLRGSITDITARKKTEARMHMLSRALEQTADAVMVTDENGFIEYVNPACEVMTGYSLKTILGKKANYLYSGQQSQKFYEKLWGMIKSGKVFNGIFVNKRKNGSLYYEEKTITPLQDAKGHITRFIATGRDISARMETQKHLEYLAHHDSLTQLPNRILLMDRLERAISSSNRQRSLTAVLFLDLDRFKIINDTLGHDIGDKSLQQVASILLSHLREVDTVARLGGDEFAIILENIKDTEEIKNVTKKIMKNFLVPFKINSHEVFMTTSIGITIYPRDGVDAGALLKNADIAMYRAKELGRNRFEFYRKDMSYCANTRLSVETKLRRALDKKEFFLLYQPFISIETGELMGAEALIRWQPIGSDVILPIEFIPILEETDLIVAVGQWVLETACQQLEQWNKTGKNNFYMAVNLSSRQLLWDALESFLESMLYKHNLNQGALELEITESFLIEQNEYTLARLNRISDMGISLSIDDFGTGYSSLSYLKRFPIDTLKIDRSFTHNMQTDKVGTSLVEAIIAMSKSLSLKTIAEGVETPEQLDILKRLNCQTAQGYYFSQPLTAENFSRLLANNNANFDSRGLKLELI